MRLLKLPLENLGCLQVNCSVHRKPRDWLKQHWSTLHLHNKCSSKASWLNFNLCLSLWIKQIETSNQTNCSPVESPFFTGKSSVYSELLVPLRRVAILETNRLKLLAFPLWERDGKEALSTNLSLLLSSLLVSFPLRQNLATASLLVQLQRAPVDSQQHNTIKA